LLISQIKIFLFEMSTLALVTTAFTAVAGKEALKKVVASVLAGLGDKGTKVLKHLRNEKEIGRLYNQLAKIRLVKTLGQLEKAVDLQQFYCDSHVYLNSDSAKRNSRQRKKIARISDFPDKANILVEGIAGQGKSIFLRYLCGQEIYRGEYIPVFAELRRIQEGQSFVDFLIKTLKTFHIDVDSEMLGELANSGKLLILLDAFDEVLEEEKSRVLMEIEDFAGEYEGARLIVTSRPGIGISSSPKFEVVRLSDLEGEEYIAVINMISEDSEKSEELIKKIKSNKGGIRDLLLTPLLVTLLVIQYKSFRELPEQLSDFYDSLFQTLLKRHDGVKPGYARKRKCKINDIQYRQVFEVFCLLSKNQTYRAFKHVDAYRIAVDSLGERKLKCDGDAFLSDIVSVTCLLVKDGEEYRFIHKSVQEYYSASCIKNMPDILIKSAYANLISDGIWKFHQELMFLEEIDPYRYRKFGLLPFLYKTFGRGNIDFKTSPIGSDFLAITNELKQTKIGYSVETGRSVLREVYSPSICRDLFKTRSFFSELVRAELIDVTAAIPRGVTVNKSQFYLTLEEGYRWCRVSANAFDGVARKIAATLFKLGASAQAAVRQDESSNPLARII